MTTVRLEVVVIGTGRSGTAWAARRLTAAGVTCGHESVFDWHWSSQPDRRLEYQGRVPSRHAPPDGVPLRAEASLAAIAHLAVVPVGCTVWHVVRHPLAVVASWAGSGILDDCASPYGRFVWAHVPAVAGESTSLGRAARWVAEWNLRGAAAAQALGLPYCRTQVEGDSEVVNRHSTADPLSWDQALEACTPATGQLLRQWAAAARYA